MGLVVANSFFDTEPAEKVTFRELGAEPLGEVTPEHYNMLDLVLCEPTHLQYLSELRSVRLAALASNHYVVKCVTKWGQTRKARDQTPSSSKYFGAGLC